MVPVAVTLGPDNRPSAGVTVSANRNAPSAELPTTGPAATGRRWSEGSVMRERTLVLVGLAILVAVPTIAMAAMSGTVSAKLTGKVEIPAGDANGSGWVEVTLDKSKGKACWDFSKVKNIGTPQAAHIHQGKAGKVGPVVIPLGAAYKTKGCIAASKMVIANVLAKPSGFYVNIHNAAYPNGAIRGQLAAGKL
jgi:hypothetical protein